MSTIRTASNLILITITIYRYIMDLKYYVIVLAPLVAGTVI